MRRTADRTVPRQVLSWQGGGFVRQRPMLALTAATQGKTRGTWRTDVAWWLMLGLGAPPLLPPLVAMRVFGDSHPGADADDL